MCCCLTDEVVPPLCGLVYFFQIALKSSAFIGYHFKVGGDIAAYVGEREPRAVLLAEVLCIALMVTKRAHRLPSPVPVVVWEVCLYGIVTALVNCYLELCSHTGYSSDFFTNLLR